MIRLLPRSLLGQVMLALAAALLVAQGLAGVLLYRAAQQRGELSLLHAAAFQLLSGAGIEGQARGDAPPHHPRHHPHHPPRGNEPRLPHILRFAESDSSPLLAGEVRQPQREAALRAILESQGIALDDLVVTERRLMADPLARAALDRSPALKLQLGQIDPRLVLVGIKRSEADKWQVARVPRPLPDPGLLPGLAIQGLILFAVLYALLYLVLRRLTRPLDALAERTRRFAGSAEAEPPLDPSGPEDVRRLILAHNAMQARIAAMLDEKDVMLGAIGHDLKTPLAALRVRVEGVADETARARMAATIAEINRTLDDILVLARLGHRRGTAERTDLAALAASVVEEFEDMGETVEFSPGERIVAPVQLTWLKRALRNLVANALRYGHSARVSLVEEAGEAVLRVEDEGPGIPEARLAAMVEPFTRGEASRNRETGGAGLGLAIARAVAEQHGGRLVLANRPEGGLRAELRLPRG